MVYGLWCMVYGLGFIVWDVAEQGTIMQNVRTESSRLGKSRMWLRSNVNCVRDVLINKRACLSWLGVEGCGLNTCKM